MPAVSAAALTAGLRRGKKKNAGEASQVGAGELGPSKFQWISTMMRQEQVRAAYQNPAIQWGIAGLIMGNFVTNIVEKQIDPWNKNYPNEWKVFETSWNIVFIVELLWNMYGTWYLSTFKGHFLCSGWNLFDLLVVSISVPSLTGADLGSFSQMRMLRAFRVFRLFKRIKSLNKIITSLGRAVPGIVNAAIVQLLVMCIYSILAVDLFGDFGAEGMYVNIEGNNVTLITTRDMTYGEEYYGNFFRSLYTLFQVLTGESWSEAVARPVIFTEGTFPYVAGIFYVTYILICGIVLVNVAVAVLLEKMVDPEEPMDASLGLSLKDMPEHARTLLEPFDVDGDGVITKDELTKAAELLKRDNGGDEATDTVAAANIAAKLEEMRRETKASIMDSMSQQGEQLKQLRANQETQQARMEAALAAAAEREALLQQSLQSLSATMEAMANSAATRPRRPKPGAPDRRGASNAALVNGANGGSAPAPSEEDKAQDGERRATKAAPERVHQCV